MAGNSFGQRFVVTSFGESHGCGLGVVIDGCPAGLSFDEGFLISELARRRPGFDELVSARKEEDIPEILSGVYQGRTLGTPLAILVRNRDQRSADYNQIESQPRVGHADDLWKKKYAHADLRGGGRSSGRETISRVMAGAVAKMILRELSPATQIIGYAAQIGSWNLPKDEEEAFISNGKKADDYVARFPSPSLQDTLRTALKEGKRDGQSFGGMATLFVKAPPAVLGQPVFHKLKADLASALMGVGAVVGVELGSGFSKVNQLGTDFHQKNSPVYGGIRGGLSTGEDILLRAAIKPTSSILEVSRRGRHDPCILIRAIPVLESMVAMVLVDHLLWSRQDCL